MAPTWPDHLPAGAVRFARPTARLAECVAFYRDALGLPVLGDFQGHDGYDGVIFGLPDAGVQLELTFREPHIPEPSPENQLVLYLPGAPAVGRVAERLRAHGHEPVPPANPYWARRGAVAFEDPDRWVVILAPWIFGRG
ncbi:hypothetical protein TH66_07395 [Carbonactinospora thermoautotrophica]|uniref:Prolyl endopeptidase n=1 Tax=Carbonactinospora thermoautotrophica TaxID=1469144 RepID=A0A132MPU2_9ACTN|nr:VOC family protein [Carbonactinospora thermoautotrophica]KWW99877.1 Prolyl endopeptidase [Carbonactinospora thermoautotrophica]KWX04410.1 hypothetical protein TH66_07395 [Carbonactinospora thermoautotrophica]KWX07370.1 hypothetical protein TR74_19030 [Carbonactinospora thermoautotrophica]